MRRKLIVYCEACGSDRPGGDDFVIFHCLALLLAGLPRRVSDRRRAAARAECPRRGGLTRPGASGHRAPAARPLRLLSGPAGAARAEGQGRSRTLPGSCALRGARARAVRARRARQRAGDRRRHRAAGAGRQGLARQGELSRSLRSRSRRAHEHASAGQRLGHRLRSSRSALDRGPVPDLGRRCARHVRSPIPSAIAASIFPSRYEDVRAVAYDTEHFSSRRIIVRDDAAAAHSGAADHVRSARRIGRRRTCCCRSSRPTRSSATSRTRATICNKLIDRFAGKRRLRCGRGLRAGDTGARHRAHARPARRRGRPLPHLDSRDPRSSASPSRRC